MKKSVALVVVFILFVVLLNSCASSKGQIAEDALFGRWEYQDLHGKVWMIDINNNGTKMSLLVRDVNVPDSTEGRTFYSTELIWKEQNQFGVIKYIDPEDNQIHFIEFILYKYNMTTVMNLIGTSTDFPVLKDYDKAK